VRAVPACRSVEHVGENDPVSHESSQPGTAADNGERTYPLAPAFRARLMGIGLVLLGIVLVVATIIVSVSSLPLDVMTVVVVLAVVFVFALGAWLGRIKVLTLDDLGYRVRGVRGVGTATARWADVHDLQTSAVAGARCVVMRLRDGASSTIPVDIVAGDSEELVREIRRRLDHAHGKRPSA